MSKISFVTLVGLLVVVSACRSAEPAPTGLGERIAGTWLGTFEVELPDFPAPSLIASPPAAGPGVKPGT